MNSKKLILDDVLHIEAMDNDAFPEPNSEGTFECFGERIICKRLFKGKIIDLYERKFYIEDNKEFPTKEDVELDESIFRHTVVKEKINQMNERNITRKNLLNNISAKENKNIYIRIF